MAILVIFLAMMLTIYIRPFGLPIWVTSMAAAAAAWAFGATDAVQIGRVWAMVGNSLIVLVGLIIWAICLEAVGFFDFLARRILQILGVRKGRFWQISRGRFFVFFMVFGAFVASFFANDGAILILTPLVFALVVNRDLAVLNSKSDCAAVLNSKTNDAAQSSAATLIPLLFCAGFISDFASNLFAFSNLTNIITAGLFGWDFARFLTLSFLPQIFAVGAAMMACWWAFGRRLPEVLSLATPHLARRSKRLAKYMPAFGFATILLLFFGIVLGGETAVFVGLVAFLAAVFALALKGGKETLKSLKNAPFSVVPFAFGLFIVVFALYQGGLDLAWLGRLGDDLAGLLAIAFSGAAGSAVINNLPMVMLGDLALKGSSDAAIMANLLGTNIGAKLTPLGSLATLLWLFSLRGKGVKIGFGRYMIWAVPITIFVLFMAVVGLYLGVILF